MKVLKLENLMPAMNDLILSERGLVLKSEVNREAASVDQEAADKFLDAIQKIIVEKGSLPGQFFNAGESALIWGGDGTKGHLLIRQRSKRQELR